MKKALLTVLLGAMVFSFCACGSTKNDSENNEKTENNQTTESKEKTKSNKNTAKKFDDLTRSRMVGSFDDVWVDFPSWREDASETHVTMENLNYYIVIAISEEDYSFDELFHNETAVALRSSVDRGDYEDFVPDTTEEVTLDNGIKATKFEGTLHMDSYGTLYNYPAYGYYFKYNNYPIMIMSVETTIGGEKLNSEEQKAETNNYVDQIVLTIRDSE